MAYERSTNGIRKLRVQYQAHIETTQNQKEEARAGHLLGTKAEERNKKLQAPTDENSGEK